MTVFEWLQKALDEIVQQNEAALRRFTRDTENELAIDQLTHAQEG